MKQKIMRIALLLFFMGIGFTVKPQEVQAATFDNAVTFYNSYGDDVVFKDGYFYYATRGLLASSSKNTTVWTTLGYKMNIKTSSQSAYIYFTASSSTVQTVSDINSGGYSYILRRISLSNVKSALSSKNSTTYNQFIASGGTITIDSCMTTVWIDGNGTRYPAGSMSASGSFSGKVYTTYDGIANAAPWTNPSSLKSYFDKSIVYATQLLSKQIVYVRYQQADGSYGSYSAVINKNYVYGEKVSWSRDATTTYKAASLSYTVTGAKTSYVTVYRQTYNQIVYVRYQNSSGGYGDYSAVINKAYYYGQTVSWSRDATTTYKAASLSYTVTGAKTSYVTVYRQTYTVSLSKGTGIASVTGGGTYYYGATCTVNATMNTGYSWSKWSGSYTSTSQKHSFTVQSNISLTANAVANTYTIVFNGNGNTGGSMGNLSMTYNVTKNLTLNAYTKKGYTFDGWATTAQGSAVYSDGESVKNLTSSSNGTINLYAVWMPNVDIYPEYILPNSSYRQGTEIIASYNIINDGAFDFTPSNPIEVALIVTSINDAGVTTQVLNTTKDVIVPNYNENLAYFKVSVPSDSRSLTFKLTVSSTVEEYDYVNNTLIKSLAVTSVVNSQTEDTLFENTPTGFTVPSSTSSVATLGETAVSNATWQIWEWNGTFTKKTYGVQYAPNVLVSADTVVQTESVNGEVTTMKSGYGIMYEADTSVQSYGSYLMPSSDAYTSAQNGALFLPEYQYSNEFNKYRTLEVISDKLTLIQNSNTINSNGTIANRRVHFIPIYYPDGIYTVKSYIYDVWTPAGMISAVTTTSQINIEGNIYEDWFYTTIQ